MKLKLPEYRTLEAMIAAAAGILRPPERISVSQAAAKYRYLDNPGAYTGPWMNEKTPYLVEVMDTLASTEFTGLALVGPARIGKTDIFYNWLTHTAITDPADMMFLGMTREVAREISQGDLGKVFRNTKKLGEKLLHGRNNDNVFDKRFKSGMRLLMRWPVISELSGKTLPRIWFADYDRMPLDVEKEGAPFDLGRKRTTTYKRFGMTAAESSPGFEVSDPKWVARTAHEAPPTAGGILGIYNRGDRRWWYNRCLHCREPFSPDFKHFRFPDSKDFMEAAEMVTLGCPHCQYDHEPLMKKDLQELGYNANWVKDGMSWDKAGHFHGKPIRTDIASFWLKGPAAAFQDWKSLVFNFLQAKEILDTTGDEQPMKKTITADQGNAYVPISMQQGRLPEFLQERARAWGGTRENPMVPEGARFLIATVDVQAGARAGFVVQITAFGEGNDAWVVDMFRLLKSERFDEAGDRLPLDPGGYLEDWKVLLDAVILKTYPLADGSGRKMAVKLTGCDYGGEEGVSVQGRQFWRDLKREFGDQIASRFQLVKGDSSKLVPAFTIKYPDANQKDKYTAARGDVPVGFINSHEMKDALSGMLGRVTPGGGMWNFPDWTPTWFYSQMTAETRTTKGWEAPKNRNRRNEAWDLSYYALTLLRHPTVRALRNGFWDNPPPWAGEWNVNPLVLREDQKIVTLKPKTELIDLADLGKSLA